jgi:hypothetical protein
VWLEKPRSGGGAWNVIRHLDISERKCDKVKKREEIMKDRERKRE